MIKSKLKRRLRKKFHIGEFRELGFEIFVNFRTNLSDEKFDKFYDDFISLMEENKLLFGGGGCSKEVEGFITSAKKFASPTKGNKERIKSWVESREEVGNCRVGNFKDAWNDKT